MYKKIFYNDLSDYLKSKCLNKKINVSYSDFENYQYQTSIALGNKEINVVDLTEYLLKKEHYESVSVTGKGFVSVRFKLFNVNHEQKNKKTVLIDYCGVNIAKKMHIGHIRSMFIGDYISRLHEFNGDKVVRINHVGDWGNQFGYLLHYIQMNGLEKTITNQSLTDYYKASTKLKDEDEKFCKDSEEVAFRLQNNLDSTLYELWQRCVQVSMTDAEKVFHELNIKMTLEDTKGESFYAPFCTDILNDLLLKNLATRSEDGSVVVFFSDKSPLVIQKSNGNFLYALYDLAALKWRQENIHPDKMVYVVDRRQSLHFEQVFDIAKRAGYVKQGVELQHVGFGAILGVDKKPLKTKEGDALYLDDLLSEGKTILQNDDYFKKLEESIKSEVLNKSIVGGMKFYDLKFNKSQDYIFDWNYVLNFTGGSAPYIQNALTRIDSIFYRLGIDVSDKSELNLKGVWTQEEQTIIFQGLKCLEVVNDSVVDYASQTLSENIIKLCQLFHKYYEGDTIIGNDQQDKKLNLLNFIYHSIADGISILGIESYRCKNKLIDELNIDKISTELTKYNSSEKTHIKHK